MKLSETLNRGLVLSNLHSKTKMDCLMEFAQAIVQQESRLEQDEIAHTLMEREKLGSTGIQDGVAIPHGKIKNLDHIVIVFGRSHTGIDFQSFDNKLTQLFFVLLAPTQATSEHLTLLARLSRLLKQSELRQQLLQAKDSDTIYNLLCSEDEKLALTGRTQAG